MRFVRKVRAEVAPQRSAYAAVAMMALACVSAAPARALDLNTVLEDVARANPTLAAKEKRTVAAEQRVGPAGVWPIPRLELGLLNVPESGALDQEPMTMRMIGVSQRVPLFGRRGLSRGAAQAAARGAEEATLLTRYELFGAAWRAYAEAFHAGERRQATVEHQNTMARMLASARARYETGAGRLEDALRAESEWARTLVNIEMFRAEEERARARLSALRGLDAEAAATREALAAPPVAPVPAAANAWLTAVAPDHPRLRELDARARSERLAARAARRSVLPDVDLGFSLGLREDLVRVNPSATPPVTTTPQQNMWSARLGFTVPIFATSDELARGRERDAMADAAEAERHGAELDLKADIAAVHAQALAAARTVGLLADTVVVTQRRALEASWSAYTAGTADLWRTLEAAHQLYVEEIALSRARESLARAEANFLALTGRGDLLGVETPKAPGSQP